MQRSAEEQARFDLLCLAAECRMNAETGAPIDGATLYERIGRIAGTLSSRPLLADCTPSVSTFEQYEPSECKTHVRHLSTCEAVAAALRAMTKGGVR